MNYTDVHAFHIPVMGLAFTIDTPLKVARFGISSAVSVAEDRLIEMMRQQICEKNNLPFFPIRTNDASNKSRRITDYLNLLQALVEEQTRELKLMPFTPGSEIVKYFEMLPSENTLREKYERYCNCEVDGEKVLLEKQLRKGIKAGSIDVNIMTKIDKDNYLKDGTLITEGSDAVAALTGYAESTLKNSSVIFSAGMNPRLFNHLSKLSAFHPDSDGIFSKRVVIKVSDYRSAYIQGMYLAKKGIWVSEFRIESGLNCGGHAFPTPGKLMGVILEEFRNKRQHLLNEAFGEYNKALFSKTGRSFKYPPIQKICVQGGLGTNEERLFLHKKYGVDGTGWGSPFLLVPEATTLDAESMKMLQKADQDDITLSDASPLGVKFYYLKNLSGEAERIQRHTTGKPGSPCTEKHLAFNTEFTSEPICTASSKYQKLKLAEVNAMQLPETERKRMEEKVLEKECLCIGLSNPAAVVNDKVFIKNIKGITVCPGPNMAWFNKVVSLQTMVDHIYGRKNIIDSCSRPHIFINELFLYINYFSKEVLNSHPPVSGKIIREFQQNLESAIEYYRQFTPEEIRDHAAFMANLEIASGMLNNLKHIAA